MSSVNRILKALILIAGVMVFLTGCVAFPAGSTQTVPKSITILISSNTASNFAPCGCHSGKWGGMPRRGTMFANVQQEVAAKQPAWPVFVVDTGDVTQGSNADIQAKKDGYIFQSYQVIGYDMVNVGMDETKLGVDQLNKFATELGIPWSSCNSFAAGVYPPLPTAPAAPPPGSSNSLQQSLPNQSQDGSTTRAPSETGNPDAEPSEDAQAQAAPVAGAQPVFAISRIVERPTGSGFKVGFIGAMVEEGARLNAIQGFSFAPYNEAILKEIQTLKKAKVGFIVLLCDSNANNLDTMLSQEVKDGVDIVVGGVGRLAQSPNARSNPLNKSFDVGTLSMTQPEQVQGQKDASGKTQPPQINEDEIISKLQPVGSPLFVPKAGGRGRLVTRLDLTLNSSGKIVDYQSEEMEVSDKHNDDPRMDLIAKGYDTEVLAQELNGRIGRNYAGSQACYKCHPNFQSVWADFRHFKAYDRIVKDNKLGDRSCTRCHAAGYIEEPRLLTYDLIPETHRDIGCEGCHPNGGRHIQLQDNIAKMTPEQRKNMTTTDSITTPIAPSTCIVCHTGQYGVGFDAAKAIQEAKAKCMAVQNPTVVPPPDSAPQSGGQ